MANKPSEDMVEQKITQQVTITAGTTGKVQIDIPKDKKVFLKGYGYSWFTSNTYQLSTGNYTMPSRSDQEGSPAIPVIYGTPFMCRSGGKLKLTITNGDASDHTYDVVFYVITEEFLEVESTGGDLNLTIGGSSGVASAVAITDSTGSTYAGVTALGIAVNPSAPSTILTGTKSATSSASALAASATCKKVTVQVDSGSANGILIGNATTQVIELGVGDSIDIDINDLSKIYVKRDGSSDATVNYIAS